MQSLQELPQRLSETYLVRRLANALRFVERSGSADDLDEQLRYLSDSDAERSHEGYSLVRIIVWATPMLGFLGTVIGITLALGQLSPEALVNAPKEAMQGLLAGLSVAFDTTALALSLSIVLMFFQFLVREVETQLLTVVDRRVEDELIGRFQMQGTATDPNVATIRRMTETVVSSVEEMASAQTQLWEASMSASTAQWSEALQRTNTVVQSELQKSLADAITSHAESLNAAQESVSEKSLGRWEAIQEGVLQQASILADQRDRVTAQTEIMERVLSAVGDVTNLEDALNQNLSALARSKNFEDTVVSLSAAIQLLTSRLGVASPGVKLTKDLGAKTTPAAKSETGTKGRAA